MTDEPSANHEKWTARVTAAVRGGATAVQLRAKKTDSRTLLALTRRLVRDLPVPVFVNDRADIALLAGAAGVHLGSEDIPVAAVRRIVPEGFIIGASLGSEDELENASAADYVGIGPVFASPSKVDAGAALGVTGFARLARLARVPAVAIGGIDGKNVGEVMAAGAENLAGIAAIGGLLGGRNAETAARELWAAIETSRRAPP